MFIRAKKVRDTRYLQLVESHREGRRVTQRVLCSLGRLDEMQESGAVDRLIYSAQKYSQQVAVLSAHDRGESIVTETKRIGPGLIMEKLWEDLGVGKVIEKALKGRKYEFAVERAIFLTVCHRLFVSGSDRAAEKWKGDYSLAGTDHLALQHLYRAMGWLGSATENQTGASPFTPRCTKDQIEEDLFEQRRDLLAQLDLVFFDTTSIYFEGAGGQTVGAYGHSKDHRPDLKQMVVGVVMDQEGTPVCSELWPGNVSDVKSLVPIAQRLRDRFGIRNVCLVADRGMISGETLREMKQMNWSYILGVRMRKDTAARQEVLTRAGRYEEVVPHSDYAKAPSPLKVKEVRAQGRRYVVCLNEDQAAKDRHDREAIVGALQDALRQGDKALIGNKGYRKFVLTHGDRFQINEAKIAEESRYDGKWVLTTDLDNLSARDVALKYKQLWMVEDLFRSMKSLLETRPIYHKCDETIRGHVFCSFLALVLRKELQDRLDKMEMSLEWADIIRDLENLIEMKLTVGEKNYVLRSETKGTVGKVAVACGISLPPVFRQVVA